MNNTIWAGDNRCAFCGEIMTDMEGEVHGEVLRDGWRCYRFGDFRPTPAASFIIKGVDLLSKTITVGDE